MKRIIRLVTGILLALMMLCIFAPFVLAVVGDISTMTANPSDTTIILTWVKANNSTSTMIRYRTDTYPTSTTDGIQAYSGTGFQTTVGSNATGEHGAGDNISVLTPGQAYYFSAWGQNGTDNSTSAFQLVMSTLAVAIPSGAQDVISASKQIPTPTMGAQMNQNPNPGSFQLEPFTSIINYFVSGSGGLGMPVNNVWETIAILGIVGSGFATYLRIRNFFVAFAVIFIVTFFAIGLSLVQGWLLGIEIVIGAGVWGIEHYLQ